MNFKLVFRLAGKTLLVEAASMLFPLPIRMFVVRWIMNPVLHWSTRKKWIGIYLSRIILQSLIPTIIHINEMR